MKYRIRFVKGELVKYIPHLDMLRLYQRAVRRANLPIAYSKGFNPHQQMSFAQPLSVGVTSISEYMDIETIYEIDINDFINRLNDCLPKGTFVIDMREVGEKEKNSMSAVEAATYYIILDKTIAKEEFQKLINRFLNENELIIEKKTKKSLKTVDIRSDIFKLDVCDNINGYNKLCVFIATGSNRNLKVDLLTECLYRYMGWEFNPYKIKYEREDLFKFNGEEFESLFSI